MVILDCWIDDERYEVAWSGDNSFNPDIIRAFVDGEISSDKSEGNVFDKCVIAVEIKELGVSVCKWLNAHKLRYKDP